MLLGKSSGSASAWIAHRTLLALLSLLLSLPLTMVINWAFSSEENRIRLELVWLQKQQRQTVKIQERRERKRRESQGERPAGKTDETATVEASAAASASQEEGDVQEDSKTRLHKRTTSRSEWDTHRDPSTGQAYLAHKETEETVWEEDFFKQFWVVPESTSAAAPSPAVAASGSVDDTDAAAAAAAAATAASGVNDVTSSHLPSARWRDRAPKPRCCPCCPCALVPFFWIAPWLIAAFVSVGSLSLVLAATFNGLLKIPDGADLKQCSCNDGLGNSTETDFVASWAALLAVVLCIWLFISRPLTILLIACRRYRLYRCVAGGGSGGGSFTRTHPTSPFYADAIKLLLLIVSPRLSYVLQANCRRPPARAAISQEIIGRAPARAAVDKEILYRLWHRRQTKGVRREEGQQRGDEDRDA